MIYQANKRQYRALEGLAHWCAEYYYTLERLGFDAAMARRGITCKGGATA
jgi:hypothetical protein